MGLGVRVSAIVVACVLLHCSAALADSDFNNGVAAAQRDEYADAETSLTAAISAPDLPAHLLHVAHLARGEVYNAQGRNDAAIKDFNAAIALKKDYLDAYLDLCETHSRLRNLTLALADCTAAIQLQPDNWRLYSLRIPLDWQIGKFDEALTDFNRFIALRPNDLSLLLGRAETYRRAGKLDQAFADAIAAAARAPKAEAPQIELGQVYLSQDDFPKALASFDTATKLAPKEFSAYELKGQVEWAMGRFDYAVDSLEESLEENSQQEDAFLWLAIARARKGAAPDVRDADRFAKTNLAPWPGPVVSLYLGKATVDEALRAADVYGLRCNADFFVGEWYSIKGNNGAAKTALQQTAKSCRPGSLFLKFANLDLGRLP